MQHDVHTSELHMTMATQREEAIFQGTGVACVLRSATSKVSEARLSVTPPPCKGHTWMWPQGEQLGRSPHAEDTWRDSTTTQRAGAPLARDNTWCGCSHRKEGPAATGARVTGVRRAPAQLPEPYSRPKRGRTWGTCVFRTFPGKPAQ